MKLKIPVWEYKSLSAGYYSDKELTILGEKGWELIGMTGEDFSSKLIFKRPTGRLTIEGKS